jgi:hypothetical protein
LALALAACDRNRDTAPAASASTSAAASPPPSAAASGFKPDAKEWCRFVFDVNHRHGLLVGNHYINPTPEQRKGSLKEGLARRDEYIGRSPPEIREDVKLQLAYYEKYVAWADAHDWNLHAPGEPAASKEYVEAERRIFQFQVDHCGLQPR